MKFFFKPILIILVIIFSISCNNSKLCDSSDKAFEAFQLYLKTKDFVKAKGLLSSDISGNFEQYIDTIFNVLKNPTIEFIPEEKDGAFGKKKIGAADLFYAYLLEDNKIYSIIGVMFSKNINCYQIINITSVSSTKRNIKNTEQDSNTQKIETTKNPQEDFKIWLLANTAVIEVHYESDWQIWVTLQSSKYTTESNVEIIAKDIARWYAKRMNKDFAICTVWQGSSVYAKGNSN